MSHTPGDNSIIKPLCKKIFPLGKIRMTLYPGLPGAGSVTPVVLIDYASAWMINYMVSLKPWLSKCNPWTSRISVTWKRVRMQIMAPSQTYWIGNSGVEPGNLCFTRLSPWLTCPSNNWLKRCFQCPILFSLVFQLQLIWSYYTWYHRYTTENTRAMFHHSID